MPGSPLLNFLRFCIFSPTFSRGQKFHFFALWLLWAPKKLIVAFAPNIHTRKLLLVPVLVLNVHIRRRFPMVPRFMFKLCLGCGGGPQPTTLNHSVVKHAPIIIPHFPFFRFWQVLPFFVCVTVSPISTVHVAPTPGAADMELVFQNCRTFNAEGSDIVRLADGLAAKFRSRLRRLHPGPPPPSGGKRSRGDRDGLHGPAEGIVAEVWAGESTRDVGGGIGQFSRSGVWS